MTTLDNTNHIDMNNHDAGRLANSNLSSNMNKMTSSFKMKALVLLCMISLPVGSHYLEATVGTLKTSFKHSMHINNTQFSILLSSVTLVNTILPLLAGIFIDDMSSVGSVRGTCIASFIIFLGSLLVSIGAELNSYPCMVTAQIIYGIGSSMIVTMQEGILSRYFRDKEIAIVIGIILSSARLTKFIAKLIAYPILNSTGSYAWPIHVATLICVGGMAVNLAYAFIMWQKGLATLSGKEIQLKGDYMTEFNHKDMLQKNSRFEWSYKVLLFLPGTFWMIPLIQLTMSSVLSSFDDIATEFVEFRYNTTSVMAGYQSSLTQVVPIVMSPLMGIVVHEYGKRTYILFAATLILMTSMILLAYTWVLPAVGMIVFSFALSLGPVSILSSASLLLPYELAGTGMGLHKCANNIGTTIVSVLVGYVQDLTYHDGNPHDDQSDLAVEYNGVMILYLSLATLSILIAIMFYLVDRSKLSGWLQASRVEREHRLQRVQSKEEYETDMYTHITPEAIAQVNKERMDALRSIGSKLRIKKTFTYLTLFGLCLFVSWVVFFTFALMPVYQNYVYV